MKESDKILLKNLLTQINTELVVTLARPTTLQQNTHDHNTLATKIKNWQSHLRNLSKKADTQKNYQNLRSQNIHNLPPHLRYSEKQSINDNLKNVQGIKRLMKKVEQSIGELLLNTLNPSDSETLFNAIEQLKSLHDWNLKLTKLNDIANTIHDKETTTLVREVTALQRHNQHNPASSTGSMPVQSMLLIIMVMLAVIRKTFRQ